MKIFYNSQLDQLVSIGSANIGSTSLDSANFSPQNFGASNFGSELNRWLWPQLKPELFPSRRTLSIDSEQPQASSANTTFVGTGTLINSELNQRTADAKKVIIFGTGLGYEQPLISLPAHWDIRCVRGPLSAKQLGLPAHKAITDSALLVSQVFSASAQRQGCSFMPHISHATTADSSWQRICEEASIRYIDPRWPVEKILRAMASSNRILSESLYGAIVADALRIPWIPIVTSPRIYSFKWQDWCTSMNLFYHPYRLPALKSYQRWGQTLHSAKHWLGAALEGPVSSQQYELFADERAIAQRLANIAKQVPSLSANDTFTQKREQLQTVFSQLCQQYARETVMR